MSRQAAKRDAPPVSDAAADRRYAAVVAAFAADRRVTRIRMFGSAGLKVRGKVFVMFVDGALVAKLPEARVDALIARGAGTRFDPGHGRLMREWIAVPQAEGWLRLAREARRFVGGGAS
jgi:TfoX/Sxy family transcriptional regulator of competence genes